MAGTLTAAIHHGRQRMHLHTALRMALDVARGLEYLHSLGIVHRGAIAALRACVRAWPHGLRMVWGGWRRGRRAEESAAKP